MPHAHHHAAAEQTIRFGSRTLAGLALWAALLEPGDEVLLVEGAAPWLAPLAELLGGHPSTAPAQEVWSEIGARTRVVVLPHDEELLALLSETEVTLIVVLEPGASPDASEAHWIAIQGATLRLGGHIGAVLASTLVHHAELISAAERTSIAEHVSSAEQT